MQEPRIAVKSPLLDSGLILEWSNGKVSLLQSSQEAKTEWEYLQYRGLLGKYGHTVDPNDTRLVDLVIAIGVLVGEQGYRLSKEAQRQIDREVEEERQNPIPAGALS